MSDAVADLLVRIDATTEQLRRELARGEKALAESDAKMSKIQKRMQDGWKKSGDWVKKHNRELKLLGAVAAGASVLAVKRIADMSDRYKNLHGQLKLVTDSQAEVNDVWDQALRISNDTGSSLDATVTLYARMARSTKELGTNQAQLLQMTETINQAFIVSGATAQESAASIIQLSQAMAKGRLDGQELNAVLEQAPRLASLIATEMDKPVGALKDLGAAGEITSEVMLAAFENGAAEIQKEFDQMPMTVGRSLSRINNLMLDAFGRTDLDPLTDALAEFGDLVADPKIIDGLTDIAGALVKVAGAGVKTLSVLPGLMEWIGEHAASASGPAADDFDRMGNRIAFLTVELEKMSIAGTENTKQGKLWRAELEKLEKVYALNLELTANAANAKQEEAEANVEVVESLEKLEEITVEATRLKSRFGDGVRDVIRELDFEYEQLNRTAREQFIYNKLAEAGTEATTAQVEAIREKAGALFDEGQRLKDLEDKTKKLAEASEKAAEKTEKAWADARSVLSDFFFEMARDGKNAFDTILDSFTSMLNKMAAELATNQFTLALASGADSAGFGGLAQNLLGTVDGNTVTNVFTSLFGSSTTSSSTQQVSSAAGDYLASIGVPSSASQGLSGVGEGAVAAEAAGAAGVSSVASLGIAALVVGAVRALDDLSSGKYGIGDLLSGNFANVKYGDSDTSHIFLSGKNIAAMGFAGADPLLTALGYGFVDEGPERVLNNIFGFKQGGNNAARSNIANGAFTSAGIGKNFSEKNLEAVDSLSTVLTDFINALGGSSFSGSLKVGNRSLIKFQGPNDPEGIRFKKVEEFLAFAFERIIEGATDLDPKIRDLALSFKGTSEEIVRFAVSVQALSRQSGINTVTQAIQDFNAEVPTMQDSLESTRLEVHTLIDEFDGSAEGAEALAEKLALHKVAAYDFAASIQAVAEEMNGVTQDQATFFRESAMTEDELRSARIQERDTLRAALDTMTDPADAQAAFARITTLNRQIFDSIDFAASAAPEVDPVRARQLALWGVTPETPSLLPGSEFGTPEDFALFIEDANASFQMVMQDSLTNAQEAQENLNARIAALLDDASTRQQLAADTQLDAAQTFSQAVDNFTNSVNEATASEVFV